MFVFLCSFIPIAGVAISTVPIGFVALTEYGFFKVPPSQTPPTKTSLRSQSLGQAAWKRVVTDTKCKKRAKLVKAIPGVDTAVLLGS